jgi:hypothetical protein
LNKFYQQQPPPTSCIIDTDGDGIRNSLDLDSDNDGCSDAVEAGVTPKASLTANSGEYHRRVLHLFRLQMMLIMMDYLMGQDI